jgi:branched-chain amino acid aminotransferase
VLDPKGVPRGTLSETAAQQMTDSWNFAQQPHPAPVPAGERKELLKDPGFGRVFTDHMVTVRFTEGRGWHDPKIEPRGPLLMDPTSMVLHYA